MTYCLDRVDRDLATPGVENLATVDHFFEAALYLGRLSREVAAHHLAAIEHLPVIPTGLITED